MIPQLSQLFIYPPDKSNSVCRIFISTPSLDKEQTLGRLFGIMEIESPDRGLWETIRQICDHLEHDYYGDERIMITAHQPSREISVEETFETAIQKCNDRLLELIKGGKLAKLLDRLNICFGVLKQNKIYFAAVGATGAFLIHQLRSKEHRMIDILTTAGEADQKLNPFKLLSHVVQGEVEEHDALLFCTGSLLDYLSQDKIKQTITTREAAAATRQLKDLLLEASINTAFAAIVIKFAPSEQPAAAAEIRLPQKSLETLITTEQKTEQYLSPPIRFNLRKASTIVLQRAGAQLRATQSVIRAAVVRQQSPEPSVRSEQLPAIEPVSALRPPAKPAPTPKPDALSPQALPWTATLKPHLGAAWRTLERTSRRTAQAIRGGGSSLIALLRGGAVARQAFIARIRERGTILLAAWLTRFRALPRSSRILLVVSVVLGILLLGSLSNSAYQAITNRQRATFTAALTEIQNTKTAIDGVLIYQDEDRAQELLTQAFSALDALQPESRGERTSVDELRTTLTGLQNTIQHRIAVTPELLVDFRGQSSPFVPAATLELSNGQLVVVNTANNAFGLLALDQRSFTADTGHSDGPQITRSTTEREVLLYTNAGNGFTRLDLRATPPTIQPVAVTTNGQAAVTDIATYLNRLYVLNTTNNQIYRYQRSGDNYGAPSNWLRDSDRTVNDGTAIAIDGDLYLGTTQGEIRKFTSGRRQAFTVKNLTPTLGAIRDLWTSADSPLLYILDSTNSRLVTVRKETGRVANQYTADILGGATAMAIHEESGAVYILTPQGIYQLKTVAE